MILCEADRAEEFINTISMDFMLRFKEALVESFASNDLDFEDEEVWINVGSTVGWGNAFDRTCDELDMQGLKQYYKKLEWFDSDVFDGDVADLAVKYGIVRPLVLTSEDSDGNFYVNLTCEFFDDEG